MSTKLYRSIEPRAIRPMEEADRYNVLYPSGVDPSVIVPEDNYVWRTPFEPFAPWNFLSAEEFTQWKEIEI